MCEDVDAERTVTMKTKPTEVKSAGFFLKDAFSCNFFVT